MSRRSPNGLSVDLSCSDELLLGLFGLPSCLVHEDSLVWCL